MPKVEEIDGREIDFGKYAAKEATSLQTRFADWLIDKCEVEFATKRDEATFRNAVRLSVSLRIPFQASDENKEATAREREANQRAAEDAREAAAEARAERKAAVETPAEKPVAKKAATKKAAPVVEEKPAPTKATRRRRGATEAAF